MKIAIHHRPGSFSDRWIVYCQKENIEYKIVNAFDDDIIHQVKDCDVFMWHHHHNNFKDVLTAQRILFALEHSGVKVFPDWKTAWHFDDKVAQKYLLEAIGAPMVPSYVFYDKQEALDWVEQTDFPKVWKLKGGAGASNVRLIKTKKEARKYVRKSFRKGFSQFNRWGHLKERFNKYQNGQDSLLGVLKGIGRLVFPTEFSKMYGRDKGYIYFQDFIPNNAYDTRVVVVGEKAVAERRMVRKNDFRASGSGKFSYANINIETIKIALDVSKELGLQSVAFDFIEDKNKKPLIVEMSYGFGTFGIKNVPGYWNTLLEWERGVFKPEEWLIQSMK